MVSLVRLSMPSGPMDAKQNLSTGAPSCLPSENSSLAILKRQVKKQRKVASGHVSHKWLALCHSDR